MVQKECPMCKCDKNKCIHQGVRDDSNIKVKKCLSCGLVYLETIDDEYNLEYENSEMHKLQYDIHTEKNKDTSWENWIKETQVDDERRVNKLKEICIQKKILDFGCGNGGFLRRIKKYASEVSGIELETRAREKILAEGINVTKKIEKVEENKYDIVTMFHVIEHLIEPEKYLKDIRRVLKNNALLIVETPNSEDALLSVYNCEKFADFTYWSKHVRLYNHTTLVKLLEDNGFDLLSNDSIQRYSLNNHLYWLAEGKPGGHEKWKNLLNNNICNEYDRRLIELKVSDTLFMIFRKH